MIELDGIRKEYPGPPRVEVLRGVALGLARGEFLAVEGPSGSGKSTLLNIIGLLDRPSGGAYLLDGQPVQGLRERDRNRLRADKFGFVFQSSHMMPDRTVAQNVALPLQIRRFPVSDRPRMVSQALESVGLAPKMHARAIHLSGGERQRAALARAIVGLPPVILADEPTGNLDERNAGEVIALLHGLRDRGWSVLVITHDARVSAAADRRVRLAGGRIQG